MMNNMSYFSSIRNNLEQFCKHYFISPKIKLFFTTCYSLMKASITQIFLYLVSLINPFWLHLCYFVVLSCAGFLSLKVSKTRTIEKPSNLDVFFTSVSAATASSMTTVEMEVFSNDQLIVMTILMLLGGEVFTSMLALHLRRCDLPTTIQPPKIESSRIIDSIELGIINNPPISNGDENNNNNNNNHVISTIITTTTTNNNNNNNNNNIQSSKNKYNSVKLLGYVVLGYIIIVHLVGSTLVTMYMSLTPSALDVLNNKGLVLQTFSFFMVVSTFSSCGYAPTNENMVIFKNNPGLLLLLLPHTFLGNTLYPMCLRVVIWVLEKLTKKKEFNYMLKNHEELEYGHLMSSKKCWYLGGTTIGLLVLQIAVFCGMDWSSNEVMEEMNSYEKFVGSLFQTANTRHSGESVVDISKLSQAVLVLFTIMMYLPPYFSYVPIGDEQEEALAIMEENKRMKKKNKKNIVENILFSQLSYLVIFVIIICITERKGMKEDPLNFTVLNVVFEVISAYGNVGLSIGYSCARRLKTDEICHDKYIGFVGKWSNGGKFALIIVMFFGRLKSFSMHGGKAWKILA